MKFWFHFCVLPNFKSQDSNIKDIKEQLQAILNKIETMGRDQLSELTASLQGLIFLKGPSGPKGDRGQEGPTGQQGARGNFSPALTKVNFMISLFNRLYSLKDSLARRVTEGRMAHVVISRLH